jgi:hypothetical protein
MKTALLFSMIFICSVTSYSQNQISDTTKRYKLYPTENMWTFIKLDTRNGRLWKVQYHLESDKRFESILNTDSRVIPENESNERFVLYSTQNTYNFILLDQIDGRMWQVQWSMDPDKRFVIPIY